jgi:hypothetical protein
VSAPAPITRRANVDDLPALRGLWQLACLPGYELEKRVTEFHLVARADGVVTGAMAFLVSGQEALVHSGAFASAAQEAEGLPALWQHLLTLAQTQGIVRIWMRGEPADHWKEAGFEAAKTGQLKKLPAAFGAARERWWALALREEAKVNEHLEKEFEALHAAQQEQTARLERQAQLWKLIAWVVAGVFLLGMGWMFILMFRTAPRRNQR